MAFQMRFEILTNKGALLPDHRDFRTREAAEYLASIYKALSLGRNVQVVEVPDEFADLDKEEE